MKAVRLSSGRVVVDVVFGFMTNAFATIAAVVRTSFRSIVVDMFPVRLAGPYVVLSDLVCETRSRRRCN